MSSWKHLREEGRHFAKKHRVGAKRALVGVLIAAMTISTMNVPAIAEELGITADAQEQIIQDSTVNTENQSATAEGTPAEGTDATVDEGDDPADTSADAATDTTADTQSADDQQSDEAAGTESDPNSLTEGASSENDPAAVEEDTTAQVAVKVANASLKYTDANGAEQTVSENKDKVDFPTQTEIKFSVTANDGFQASRVFYTVDGADTDVAADESGTYTIPAEVVNDGLAITVETAEIPAADEPAADDAAGEADGVATLTINVENSSVTLTNAEGEEQTLTESQDVQVAEGKDLSLTVQPDDGYEIEDVVVSDGESELAVSGEDDSYAVPSDSVSDGASIQVNALAASARANVENLEVDETKIVTCDQGDWRHSHRWWSSNESVATVSTDGLVWESGTQTVTAVGPGEATIYCGDEAILTVHVTAPQATVHFDPNGGDGDPFILETTSFENGSYRLSLPTLEESKFSRDGYTFVGWSTDKSGQGQTYTPQEIAVTNNETYYAIWAENNANRWVKAEFFLRIDGDIPYEPDANIGAGGAGYFPGGCGSGLDGYIKQGVAINNNNELVAANIQQEPNDDAIQQAIGNWNSTHSDNQMSRPPRRRRPRPAPPRTAAPRR